MGYQALLFCPDEKTARTVTQVLNELEFAVEACIEPFAAVKKLMGQHFDAVVVDCDNEQNATLLFKSARNSTSNQTSLAVAVVEGQAGVAKAFRIGANLVLTKPINIEQAKGTLRVARGLLRKSDPAKAGGPSVTPVGQPPAPLASRPAPLKPISAAKPPAAIVSPPVAAPKPNPPSAWPVSAAASSRPVVQDQSPLEIDVDDSVSKPVAPVLATFDIPVSIPPAEKAFQPQPAAPAKPAFSSPAPFPTSGAASAPAPARTIQPAPVPEVAPEASAAPVVEKPAEASSVEPSAIVGSAPSFTFGGVSPDAEPKTGSKKILFGAVAAALIAAVGYVGWTQFSGHASAPATAQVVATPATLNPQPSKPAAPAPVATTPAQPVAAPKPTATVSSKPASDDADSMTNDVTVRTVGKSVAPSNGEANPTESGAPAAAAMIVKSGKVPATQSKVLVADAPAPSLIGLSAPGDATAAPTFVPSTSNAFKPVLQTLTVSQGVSQGLLIKKVAPSYPTNALRMHIEGTVELLATVSKSGDITHIKVIRGDGQLTRGATEAVKQWKYRPYLLNGEPVEIQTQITVNFKLPR
jgi:periplasmic protein TonB